MGYKNLFTPDEGGGKALGADFGYTLDGGSQ